tara:strand:+ start:7701 stop:7847 length:147 start_codon:yes stop_codon:yes gene_type:complete
MKPLAEQYLKTVERKGTLAYQSILLPLTEEWFVEIASKEKWEMMPPMN